MRNIEIKAKVKNLDRICQIAEEMSGGPATVIHQEDIFYKVNRGRLKMRYHDEEATLVRYDREDELGPKLSNYELLHFSTSEMEKAKLLDQMLQKSVGLRGKVVKTRRLFMVSQTRIHVDTVEELGHFMELEVVLRPEQTEFEGHRIAQLLTEKLGVKGDDLIDCAYIDLLEAEKKQ